MPSETYRRPSLAHGEVQRPGQAARQHRLGLAAAQDLGDQPGEAGDEQAVPGECQVVQAGGDGSQHGALAAAGIDPQDLPGGDLGRDDPALGVELHRVRDAEIPRHPLGLAAVRVDPPDVVGAQHRVVQLAVRPGSQGVGHRQVLQEHPRRAAGEVELQQATADPALVDEQPAPVEGDAVRAGHVVAQHPGAAAGAAHAHPPVVVLGGVEVALGVEIHVVGRDDVGALRADRLQLAGVHVERADLAARHLRHVDAAVRAGTQAVRAEQAARRGQPFQVPSLGQADGGGAAITRRQQGSPIKRR